MEDNSNSKNKKKAKETIKLSSKKAKGTKDPNRSITDLANKYSKLSRQIYPYEDIMKQASLANDIERQMRTSHDVMRIMEESTRVSREMDRLMGPTLTMNNMLGYGTMQWAVDSLDEKLKHVFEDPINNALSQIENYAAGKIEDFSNTVKDALSYKPLEDLFTPLSEQFAWMASLPMNPITEVLEDIEGIHNIKFKDIFNMTSEMKEFYANLPEHEIVVQEDQSIACAGKAYEIASIEKALKEKLENAGFLTDPEIGKENFNALLSGVEKIGEPSLKSIIISFLISMFVSIIMLLVTPHLENIKKNLLSQDKATVTKLIEKDFPKTLPDKNVLYNYRFVTANPLSVWNINRQRSKLVGELLFGSVVRVIQKKKNWTLVEWKDQDTDSVIQGWVFSRYLKKFKI